MKKTLLILSFCFTHFLLFAQDGTLDSSFGTNGRVTTSLGGLIDIGRSVLIQKDGKIIVSGASFSFDPVFANTTQAALVRYNTNGSLDLTFGVNGKVVTSLSPENFFTSVTSLDLQDDGKIIAAGTASLNQKFNFALARFNTNGSFDTTFNRIGIVLTTFGIDSDQGSATTIQTDGKIIVAGSSDSRSSPFENGRQRVAVARYNKNGSLDTTFNGTGKVITHLKVDKDYAPSSVIMQNDNKIVVSSAENTNQLLPNQELDIVLIRYKMVL